jgi:homocitrate synthase NifV
MFAHESGIHADGALKHPETYEVFNPLEVGLERQIVIGKHSGTAAIVNILCNHGIEISKEDARELLENVRKASISLKRSISEKELVYLYHEWNVSRVELGAS